MKVKHYDLFAGIGGFSYALDQVFNDQETEHIFCEWEAFPTAVLKKHWPDGTYYGDIADLVADTNSQRERDGLGAIQKAHGEVPERDNHAELSNSNSKHEFTTNTKRKRLEGSSTKTTRHVGQCSGERSDQTQDLTILTGGFPCQPFSHAGRRQGTADDRYKWPEMFAVIRNVQPDWVIAENVAGLNSMVQYGSDTELEEKTYSTEQDARAACEESHAQGQGYRTGNGVLGTVVGDLEKEGYTVQTFIIPACAIQAPHQRERVWIVANLRCRDEQQGSETVRPQGVFSESEDSQCFGGEWNRDWREVALATCNDRVDDGLPRRLDGATYRGKPTDCISAAQHRKERLKACGNAIVPQVAMEIFKAIKMT